MEEIIAGADLRGWVRSPDDCQGRHRHDHEEDHDHRPLLHGYAKDAPLEVTSSSVLRPSPSASRVLVRAVSRCARTAAGFTESRRADMTTKCQRISGSLDCVSEDQRGGRRKVRNAPGTLPRRHGIVPDRLPRPTAGGRPRRSRCRLRAARLETNIYPVSDLQSIMEAGRPSADVRHRGLELPAGRHFGRGSGQGRFRSSWRAATSARRAARPAFVIRTNVFGRRPLYPFWIEM